MSTKNTIIISICVVIVIVCAWYGYSLIHRGTDVTDSIITELKQELQKSKEEIVQMKTDSERKTVVIKQTVKEEIKYLPVDQVAKGILEELAMEGD